jgi:anti-anti-sigma regulatory factor
MTAPLVLGERLDRDAARDLHAALVQRRGEDMAIDGSAVRTAGALAVQVLLAAARDGSAQGRTLTLTASAAMREDLARLGVLNEFFLQEVT